jgi:hypothetical protein
VGLRNRLAEAIGVWLPIGLAVTGVLAVDRFNLLPATEVFLAAFFVVVALSAKWLSTRNAGLVCVLALILVTRFAVILDGQNTPLQDALRAHMWLLYLIGLCLLSSTRLAHPNLVVPVTKILLTLALVKYSIAVFQFGGDERPGIFTENNFELSLLSGMLAVTFDKMGGRRYLYLAALGVTTLLSDSRSGAIEFVIVMSYVIWADRRLLPLARYLLTLFGLAALFIPISVFRERFSSGSSIDRVKFIKVFFSESASWTPVQWLFGTRPLTPLSSSGCSSLSYYEQLFSTNGQCYSVVMHMFLLRVVYDFGLVGLILAISLFYRIMRRAGVARALALTLTVVAVSNSASVSGLNNVYVVWPAMMAILTLPMVRSLDDPRHAQFYGKLASKATRSFGSSSIRVGASRRITTR